MPPSYEEIFAASREESADGRARHDSDSSLGTGMVRNGVADVSDGEAIRR